MGAKIFLDIFHLKAHILYFFIKNMHVLFKSSFETSRLQIDTVYPNLLGAWVRIPLQSPVFFSILRVSNATKMAIWLWYINTIVYCSHEYFQLTAINYSL